MPGKQLYFMIPSNYFFPVLLERSVSRTHVSTAKNTAWVKEHVINSDKAELISFCSFWYNLLKTSGEN